MKQQSYLPIGAFSRLTGIRTDNLRFYNRIGLLTPEIRAENGYRYYNRRQIDMAFLISDLRAVGVGLEEIRQYAEERSPEKMLTLFTAQNDRIEDEIKRLREIQDLMRLHTKMARQALAHGGQDIFLEEREQEPIYLGSRLPHGMSDEEGMLLFYEKAEEEKINLSYPLGVIVAREDLEKAKCWKAERYYLKAAQGHNAHKPAGLYAVAYGLCDMEEPYGVYAQLFAFLRAQELTVAGNSYEEYPLNELSTPQGQPYCVRIEVPVERRA